MSQTLSIRHLFTIAIAAAVLTLGGVLRTQQAREQQALLDEAIVERNRMVLAVAAMGGSGGEGLAAEESDALERAALRNHRILVVGNLATGMSSVGLLLLFILVLRPAALMVARTLRERDEEVDALQRSISARSRLLARVSKQLRTPMNGVIGMAELLQASELSRTQQEYARLIDLAARELLGVVVDVNAWVRMESGEEPVFKVPMSVHSLVDVVVGDHHASAQAKTLQLSAQVAPELPARIITDEHVVSQVLNNLVGNAVRYTVSGQVALRVDCDRDEVRFTVADTGPGMSPEQVVRALSRDRLGALDGREEGAIGIGLMVCGHQAERLGGRLAIDSQLGAGSRITLHIPREVPDCVDVPVEAGFRGLRALVIAPLPLQRRYLKDTLEGWGVTVETEQDPLRALGRMREAGTGQAPLDIVFIAQDLPIMSGVELAVRTGMARGARTIRMVLLDGQLGDLPRHEALAAGFSEVVAHPWKPRQLREAAESALHGHLLAASGEGRSVELTQRVQPAATAGERVLIADGNPVNQVVLRAQLQRMGLRVSAVETAQAALTVGLERSWAAIFLDARLPGQSGVDTARQLRRRLGDLCPPIILVVSDDDTSIGMARDAGAAAVLARPFTRGQLESTLQRSLVEETSSGVLRIA